MFAGLLSYIQSFSPTGRVSSALQYRCLLCPGLFYPTTPPICLFYCLSHIPSVLQGGWAYVPRVRGCSFCPAGSFWMFSVWCGAAFGLGKTTEHIFHDKRCPRMLDVPSGCPASPIRSPVRVGLTHFSLSETMTEKQREFRIRLTQQNSSVNRNYRDLRWP